MELGKYNTLIANRYTSVGLFLENTEGEDVLLPMKWVPKGLNEGDSLEVFIYLDGEERPIATTTKPFAQVGEFAYLKVKQQTAVGAFMDWGLEKDLLVPFIEQNGRLEAGHSYLVYVYLDEMTDRVAASSKIENWIEKEDIPLKYNQEVDLLVGNQTPLGFNVIIDNAYLGLIYENEVFKTITPGDRIKGFVKQIREDHKIDVSLQKQGYSNVEPNAQIILDKLKEQDGHLALHDKSDPKAIVAQLGMSKKTFKKAIGGLFKQKLISIGEDGIKLL